MNPRHPVYIVSKGRADSRLTSKHLHRMNVPHFIVVEAQELAEYAAVVDSSCTLLVLDPDYQRDYDTCDSLGDAKGKGPGPARNFAWEHSIANGASWHWVMDDNIRGFYRLADNFKHMCADGAPLAAMEDFVERYMNVAMAGPNYAFFAKRKQRIPPFILNTRIYSCNLIRNDVPFRWRARYNEDTDLSLRMLKAGWVTIQFNAFLQRKTNTQLMKGGNTDEFYEHEGTHPKSLMQVRLHPDVSRFTWRFGRIHHYVDYSGFKQKPRRRDSERTLDSSDPYGMTLVRRTQ